MTDNKPYAGAHLHDVGDFGGQALQNVEVEAGALLSGESFAGQFEQGAFVLKVGQ